MPIRREEGASQRAPRDAGYWICDGTEIAAAPIRRKHYRITEHKDEGFGRFNLYCDGDWLETFATREAAEIEMKNRKDFDHAQGISTN